MDSFDEEISSIEKCLPIKKGNLIPLASLLEKSLIRVGNRIGNALVPYYQKHKLINSEKHHLESLIVSYYHEKNLFWEKAHFKSNKGNVLDN